MKTLRTSTKFEKDFKLAIKRKKNIKKLEVVLDLLTTNQTLSPKYRPHKLSGDYASFWECHIEPDWLLIYTFTDVEVLLVRMGTHADLFE